MPPLNRRRFQQGRWLRCRPVQLLLICEWGGEKRCMSIHCWTHSCPGLPFPTASFPVCRLQKGYRGSSCFPPPSTHKPTVRDFSGLIASLVSIFSKWYTFHFISSSAQVPLTIILCKWDRIQTTKHLRCLNFSSSDIMCNELCLYVCTHANRHTHRPKLEKKINLGHSASKTAGIYPLS